MSTHEDDHPDRDRDTNGNRRTLGDFLGQEWLVVSDKGNEAEIEEQLGDGQNQGNLILLPGELLELRIVKDGVVGFAG